MTKTLIKGAIINGFLTIAHFALHVHTVLNYTNLSKCSALQYCTCSIHLRMNCMCPLRKHSWRVDCPHVNCAS